MIDCGLLSQAIRSTDIESVLRDKQPHEVPAHLDFAKRAWRTMLIDECDGDLLRIGAFWDRGSEKTLRKLVKSYGLSDRLEAARARRSQT